MKRLATGKIPIDVLNATFLKMTGTKSPRIVTPAKAGLDFAAIKIGRKFIVVSSDPVTGVVKDIGRYAVNVSVNDVATSGNRPQFIELVVLLPEGAEDSYVRELALQVHSEAKRLGVGIVGGHTEVTPGLARPIVVVTTFSVVDSYISSGDARKGDTIMLTKTAGLEGTAVLSGGNKFPKDISVVNEATTAYETGFVRAMHDCTEGGVLGAVFEMSLASGLGFEIKEGLIPVSPQTRRLCRKLRLDPLKLIGSGSLLLAVRHGKEAAVEEALAPICRVSVIGRFRKSRRVLVHHDERKERVESAPEDELWRVLGRGARSSRRL